MRKDKLTRAEIIGQARPLPDATHLGRIFSLLEAIPFTLTGGQILKFDYPDRAARLLRHHSGDVPKTLTDWTDRLSFADQSQRNAAIKRLTWEGAQYRLSYQLRLDTGEQIWIEETGERLSGEGPVPSEIIGVFRQVDRAKQELEKAAYNSRYDALSGLMNSASFTDAVNHVHALIKRQHSEAALIRLRVTNLSEINNIYGYETGDRLISKIGQRLGSLLRTPDHLARLDGSDFGICLIDVDRPAIETALERLKAPLLDIPYQTPHGGLYLEFSSAVMLLSAEAVSASEALMQTRSILDDQEIQPGWHVSFYDSAAQNLAAPLVPKRQDEEMTQEIIAALNERRISLAYQPIVDARTRDLHHYECLLRLRREDGEIYSAGAVIMAAEKLGLVHLLDRRALELAAETLRTMPDVHLALNVSAATLRDEAAVEDYLLALKSLGQDAGRLTLELTETAALDDPGLASFFSVETRKLGCAFAIDDFGSGYTTFRNLMAIEADSIKIDGSYIQGIATEPHKETFVRMMVDLAQTFSVKTVAEMVDDRADAELLRRLGVDYLQGYMFGIPSAAPAWRRAAG